MCRNTMFRPTLVVLSMTLSTMACAAAAAKADQPEPVWFAETGLGYDSNVFQAPRNAYVDYAAIPLGSNPTVVPQAKSGFFVPYKARVEAGKRHEQNGHLVGSAIVDGRFYLGGLSNANEFNLEAKGGSKFDFGKGENSNREAYAGLVFEKHNQVYADHDSGASKTTAGGSNISNRYNYTTVGIEGEFKDKLDRIDYSIKGQLLGNDYDDPVVVSQLDHTYLTVGGEVDYQIKEGRKLKFSAAHSSREYSDRHARRADGVYSATHPLLKYTYDELGVTLRNRVSADWLFYVDYDYTQRADGYVNYNDYKSHRVGGRLMYEQGALKGKVALHHWKRDYPHAYAYDAAGQPAKTYSGNDLRFKAEFAQTRQLSFWAEAILDTQDSSDKRYAYDRKQIMAGVRWDQ